MANLPLLTMHPMNERFRLIWSQDTTSLALSDDNENKIKRDQTIDPSSFCTEMEWPPTVLAAGNVTVCLPDHFR